MSLQKAQEQEVLGNDLKSFFNTTNLLQFVKSFVVTEVLLYFSVNFLKKAQY